MGIGIISDEELNRELTREVPQETRAVVKEIDTQGRKKGDTNIGESVRKVIAQEVLESGNGTLTARTFGISDSQVTAYKNGRTSPAGNESSDLVSHVLNVRRNVVKKAANRLESALDGITEDKLSNASLRESSAIARDMAAIIRDMTPNENEKQTGPLVQFVLHAPAIKDIKDYEVIDLNEQ
jgi:hypothetical protein